MARKIVITSGKGGVGKTTVAVALAAQLGALGERVVVFDADFGLNNVDLVTGVENLVTYDIVDVIEGKCRAKQALVCPPHTSNLYVLSSARASAERYVSPQAVKVVLETLAPLFDYIIIDCPSGIDDGFHRAASNADEAIVIVTPDVSSVRDADKVVNLLKSYEPTSMHLIVNKARGDLLLEGEILSPAEIGKILKLPLLYVLEEKSEQKSVKDFLEDKNYRILAQNVKMGKRRIPDITKKYTGLFGAIKRMLKRSL